MQDPVKFPDVLQPNIWDCKVTYPSYIFDSRLTIHFPKEFHTWWQKHYVYTGSKVNDVKVRLVPKTNRTLEHLFIHKKPPKEILTRMEPSIS